MYVKTIYIHPSLRSISPTYQRFVNTIAMVTRSKGFFIKMCTSFSVPQVDIKVCLDRYLQVRLYHFLQLQDVACSLSRIENIFTVA